MVVAGSGERVIFRFIISHACQLTTDMGILQAKAVVPHEEHVASQKLYVDVLCPVEKAHRFPVEEMTVARV